MKQQGGAGTVPAAAVNTRLAAAVAAILAAAPTHAPAAEAAELEEIQVTATRRSESISDVPYNISAVSGIDIAAAGITDLQGLTHMIPGLVSPDLGPRGSSINSNLTIRGLNASSINAETQQIGRPAGLDLCRRDPAVRQSQNDRHRPRRGAARPAGDPLWVGVRSAAPCASSTTNRI